jgi:divalent metal cation (Fe/Co/Zn/Cd) transporter
MFHPVVPESLDIGLVFVAVSTIVNFFTGYLLKVGRKTESIVLEADGHHSMSDVWVTIGLLLVSWTQRAWIDPVLALVVACNILRVGFDLMRRSFDGLMDHAPDEKENERIRGIIEQGLQPDMTYHALRTRRGRAAFHGLSSARARRLPGEKGA